MATKRTFNFKLTDTVKIDASGETGEVVARMQSIDTQPQYSVRYRAGDGRAVEQWWGESALSPA